MSSICNPAAWRKIEHLTLFHACVPPGCVASSPRRMLPSSHRLAAERKSRTLVPNTTRYNLRSREHHRPSRQLLLGLRLLVADSSSRVCTPSEYVRPRFRAVCCCRPAVSLQAVSLAHPCLQTPRCKLPGKVANFLRVYAACMCGLISVAHVSHMSPAVPNRIRRLAAVRKYSRKPWSRKKR